MTSVRTPAATHVSRLERERTVASAVGQFVQDSLLNVPGVGLTNFIKRRALQRVRSRLLRYADPLIRYKLEGTELLMPLSHDLPMILKNSPHYSRNLPRIAAMVAERSRGVTLVDIGANVGDTVVLLRERALYPILCIEGSERYFGLLSHNLAALDDVELEHALVGTQAGTASVHEERGTGWLVAATDETGGVAVKQLSDILQSHPRFREPRLIKVDTDGMDCPILASELELLARVKPVLFFEYVPDLLPAPGEGLAFLEQLRQIGYSKAIVYLNDGEYQLTVDLADKQRVEDVNALYEGWGINRYCDLCVFHGNDAVLGEDVRQSELRHFRDYRRGCK